MKGGDDIDAVDFKPFFDLIVGVLFILLILIAAQMFFAQHGPDGQPREEAARSDREVLRLAQRAEALRFLDDLAADLKLAGFSASVDRAALTIVTPTSQLLAHGAGPGCLRPVVDRAAAARFGRALLVRLSCESANGAGAPGCSVYRHGGQVAVAGELQVPGKARDEVRDGTPSSAHRAAALDIAGGVFAGQPNLLGLKLPNGGLLVDPSFTVSAAPAVASQDEDCGRLRLGFPILTPRTHH